MANVNVDTSKLREAGNEIIKLSSELNDNVNGLFERLAKMPVVTREWVGESATEFARLANIDKINYQNLRNSVYNYGRFLIISADQLERAIKDCSYNK